MSTRRQLAGGTVFSGVLLAIETYLGVDVAGASVAIGYAVLLALLVDRHSIRFEVHGLGPAGAVTLIRAMLVGGLAALIASGTAAPSTAGHVTAVGLAALALGLDGIDGAVARCTSSVSRFGARFDAEVDAVTLVVLSAAVAHLIGGWVLLIGLMRYAFLAAGRLLPWLAGDLPVRRSAKVVAATQGIVLVVVLVDVVPRSGTSLAAFVALMGLIWSFARSVHDRWRATRSTAPIRRRP